MEKQYSQILPQQQQQLLLLLNQLEQQVQRYNLDHQTLSTQLKRNEEIVNLSLNNEGQSTKLSPSLFTHKISQSLLLKKKIAHQHNSICKVERKIKKLKQLIQTTKALIAVLHRSQLKNAAISVSVEIQAHQIHTRNAAFIALHQRILFAT